MPKQIIVKSVLNKTKKRDSWFLDDYSVNMYSSCAFNCLYCYIRGSKYGTNLANTLSVKSNAVELLDRQLFNRARKEQYGIIVVSSATEPYMKIEQEYELTREALKLILKYRFPVHIITKSDLVIRDFDLLQSINRAAILPKDLQPKISKGTIISFSFSMLDDEVAKIFEPGATPPSARLKAVNASVKANFLTGISMMPLLPFISDTTANLDRLYGTFKAMNIDYILPATLTLHGDSKASSKTLVTNAIKKHFPALETRYINYFKYGYEMPKYYQEAFYKKMKSLSKTYGIADSILSAADIKYPPD